MRRLAVGSLALAVAAGALALVGAQGAGSLQPVEAKERGTLKGKVVLKGKDPAPALAAANKALQEKMAGHVDKGCCMGGKPEEVTSQAWRLGDNTQVGNVFVWFQAPRGSYFPIDAKQAAAARADPVEIDQPHCAFLPHCAILFPGYPAPANPKDRLPTGQTLTVLNGAPVAHNVRWPEGNQILPVGGKIAIELQPGRLPVQFQCNIHLWMDARVLVLNHPYATLSRSDTAPAALRVKKDDDKFGSYEIANVPAGVRLRLFAWHEEVGFVSEGKFQGEEIELKPGINVKDFTVEMP
jgi:hypothetical protein